MTSRETEVVSLEVAEIRTESPTVKTFGLDNGPGNFPPHLPGQHAKLCAVVDGREHWKSFTISSAPRQTGAIEFTIKRNPSGVVSSWLHNQLAVGDLLPLKGPRGCFFLDPAEHVEPLIWIAAGIGITPILSMLRWLADRDPARQCRLIYGARHSSDIFFASELREIQRRMPNLEVSLGLTQPPSGWRGFTGRILPHAPSEQSPRNSLIPEWAPPALHESRCYLCCPGDLNARLSDVLQSAGVLADHIHCEQFFKSDKPNAGPSGRR